MVDLGAAMLDRASTELPKALHMDLRELLGNARDHFTDLGKEVDVNLVNEVKPDAIILATGGKLTMTAILLKVAGWNLLQAARALAMRQKRQIAVALG